MDRIDVTLKAEVDLAGQPPKVSVNAQVQNLGAREAFVMHRLWVADLKGKRTWDPEQVYRFVDKGSLRLLFGPSPLPVGMAVSNPQFPHATKLAPNDKLELALELALPFKEYALFQPLNDAATYTPTRVHRIDVLVQWAVLDEGVKANESFIDPQAYWMSMGRSQLHTTHASVDVRPFEVMRCDLPMARPVVPSDERP